MANGIGNIPVNELKEVQDLAKNFEQTIAQVDKKFENINDIVGDVAGKLQRSKDLQKSSTEHAQDLAKHYNKVLNFVNKQNLTSRISLGISTIILKFKKNITQEEKDLAKTTADAASEHVSLRDYARDFKKELIDSGKLTKSINKGIALGAVAFGAMATIATKFAAMIDSIGSKFGSLTNMGSQFQSDLLDSSVEATKLGGGIEDVAAITSTLASNFGMNVEEAAKLSSKVFDTSKAIGISADEGANLFGVLTQTADLSADQAERLAEGAAQLARQRGVAPQAVLKDIAGSAETIAIWTKDGGDNLVEAAVAAREMGLSLDSVAKAARSSLDFQSSLEAELTASAMLGQQINLQKARELALDKDLVGFQEELKNQLGAIGDFTALNALEQESVSKALGRSVSEVAKLASGTE